MKLWDKLLQSSIPEDIALGIFLMDRDGKLGAGRVPIPNNKQLFVIDTDRFSCWTSQLFTEWQLSVVDITKGTRWGQVELYFDFRTK